LKKYIGSHGKGIYLIHLAKFDKGCILGKTSFSWAEEGVLAHLHEESIPLKVRFQNHALPVRTQKSMMHIVDFQLILEFLYFVVPRSESTT
jgi:hypothetical protein